MKKRNDRSLSLFKFDSLFVHAPGRQWEVNQDSHIPTLELASKIVTNLKTKPTATNSNNAIKSCFINLL